MQSKGGKKCLQHPPKVPSPEPHSNQHPRAPDNPHTKSLSPFSAQSEGICAFGLNRSSDLNVMVASGLNRPARPGCPGTGVICPKPYLNWYNSTYQRFRGTGGDGGVEALWISPNGEKWELQAKYFDGLGDSQFAQMTESLQQAAGNHPKLKRYTFCIPFNPTGPTARGAVVEVKVRSLVIGSKMLELASSSQYGSKPDVNGAGQRVRESKNSLNSSICCPKRGFHFTAIALYTFYSWFSSPKRDRPIPSCSWLCFSSSQRAFICW